MYEEEGGWRGVRSKIYFQGNIIGLQKEWNCFSHLCLTSFFFNSRSPQLCTALGRLKADFPAIYNSSNIEKKSLLYHQLIQQIATGAILPPRMNVLNLLRHFWLLHWFGGPQKPSNVWDSCALLFLEPKSILHFFIFEKLMNFAH